MRFKLFLEREGEEDKKTLYLFGKIPEDFQKKYYENLDVCDEDTLEMERDPHMTFLYLPEPVRGMSGREMYECIQPLLQGKSFTVTTKAYEVFKGVGFNEEKDAADCLVVRLEASDEMKEIREEVKQKLKDSGCEFTETYPEYKPHMTIGYFKKGKTPMFENTFEAEEILLPEIQFQYGGSDKERQSF